MKRAAALRHTGFGSKLVAVMDRDQRIEARTARMANLAEIQRAAPAAAKGVIERVIGPAPAQPKEQPVRSERYLRLVAALPCKACGRLGRSQAAHLPPDGKQIKQDDRLTFPLCADEPGALGCHSKYDRYILFPREKAMEQGRRWAADTRAQIRMAGTWPKNLPGWGED